MNELIPTPEVVRQQIERTRTELRDLRRLLRISERHHNEVKPEPPKPMKLETK